MDKVGSITIISGPMFSGKTDELIRRIDRLQHAKKKVAVFKPRIDNRYNAEKVCAHNGKMIDSYIVKNAKEIISCLENKKIDVVAIDEIQFFDEDIEWVVQQLAVDGYIVIGAGLDKDFRGQPFGSMPYLKCIAEENIQLTAICNVCGEEAPFTQRLVNGNPASYYDETVLVGADESYEARCRRHHIVYDHPGFQKIRKVAVKE